MLILAAIGVAAMVYGWVLIGSIGIFKGNDNPNANDPKNTAIVVARRAIEEAGVDNVNFEVPEVSVRVLDPAQSKAQLPWEVLSRPFQEVFGSNVTVASFTYLLLCGLWALLVWSLFGAAITRSAALWFAREDRLGFRRSLGWGVAKWPAYFGAVLFPFLGVVCAALLPAAIGFVLWLGGFFTFLAGLLWFVVLLCALFIAILLVGILFGWPLMWATISVEGTDSFDAVSRSYSYTYQRPVHYLFYAAVAGILGMLGWIAVVIFCRGVETYSYWAASWGSGVTQTVAVQEVIRELDLIEAEKQAGWPDTAERKYQSLVNHNGWFYVNGVRMIRLWLIALRTIAIGYLFSYFWCAATFIYYLLRQSVDATEMDEVAVDEEAESYALPPLQQEPGAPPQVADVPPASS
jgi:hypothetical protein